MADHSPPTGAQRVPAQAAGRGWLSLRTIAFVVGGFVGLLLVGGFAATTWVSYTAHLKDAERQTRNLALVLDEHAQRTFRVIDLTLKGTAMALAPLLGRDLDSVKGELADVLAAQMEGASEILNLSVVGPDGRRVVDALRTPGAFDDSGSPSFLAHRDRAGAGVLISEPLMSRTGRGWIFVASRRLDRPDGSFAGFVAASLSIDNFLKFYGTLAVGVDDAVMLRNRNGIVFARHPPAPEQIGKEGPNLGVIESVRDGRGHGTLTIASSLGVVSRITSFRAVEGTPFVVSVGAGGAVVSEGWRRDTLNYALVTLVLIGIIAALIWGVAWQIERRARDRKQAADATIQAQKMEAIGQLTGGVAHDFNNLLTVILSGASLLVESLESTPALQGLAKMIEESALRGATLTHRLLAFARQQPLQPAGVDLNVLVTGMEDLLRRTLGVDIDIVVSLDEALPPVLADAGEVENALLNLVINARDAMPDGGMLTIETAAAVLDADYAEREGELEPGSYAVLAVTDTGTGMTPEVQRKVFEPFFTTKDVGKGTGLGLSMVFGFAKQSGGHVKIFSEVGVGTAVRLYLPWAGEQDLSPAGPTDPPQATPGEGAAARLAA